MRLVLCRNSSTTRPKCSRKAKKIIARQPRYLHQVSQCLSAIMAIKTQLTRHLTKTAVCPPNQDFRPYNISLRCSNFQAQAAYCHNHRAAVSLSKLSGIQLANHNSLLYLRDSLSKQKNSDWSHLQYFHKSKKILNLRLFMGFWGFGVLGFWV